MSNNTISHIDDIISGQKIFKKIDRQNYLVLLYRYKRDVARHIIIYSLSQQGIAAARLKSELKKFDELQTPIFPISGKDLMARGFQSGPELGAALRALENKWIKSGFKSVSLDAMLRR
jgi:tRNA nucleotidyltransferase/poly(A) polymerase